MFRKLFSIIILCIFLSYCSTWSTSDKLILSASLTATATDYYTTKQALKHSNLYETNPIYGKHPSDEMLIGTMAASNILLIIIAHYYPEVRKYILGSNAITHGAAAWYNSTLY